MVVEALEEVAGMEVSEVYVESVTECHWAIVPVVGKWMDIVIMMMKIN